MKELSPVPPDALAVETRDLRKEFVRKDRKRGKRRVAALEDVTLEVARGECVAILGQNGSGKSTLVRLLSTLLLHDGGSARVFGYDVVREDKAVRRLVNRVSVEASFFKKMSPSENLHYAARFYGMTPSETRSGSPTILERVGFPPDRRTEPMENLSRGMQQKVALARALLTSPVLLLLDEPTTGLDPRSKLEVQDFIREMRAVHDSTILLCTHDLAEAEALADRIGILDRGELLALEPADELKARFDAETLEEAFFAATGRGFEDERTSGRRGEEGVRLRAVALELKHELIGLAGVVERNVYLTRRYIWWDLAFFVWTVANTLTIVFIAKGIEATGGQIDVDRATTTLLIGAVVWAYLGIIFEFITETVAWERWEGTIEYTFMAPLSRAMHLGGSGVFAVLYGLVRAILLFVVVAAFFGLAVRGRELPGCARDPDGRVRLVLRDRDDDRRAAADLAGEGRAARLRRAGDAARRLGRLLPGRGAARVDAVAREDLAGDVRARRDPRLDPRRRLARVALGRHLAAARDRRASIPARAR